MQQGYYAPVQTVGGGIPKWRMALVFVAVVVLLTKLPTESVQGDSFGAPSVSCRIADVTVASFSVVGYASVAIAFHLTLPEGGAVGARWEFVYPDGNVVTLNITSWGSGLDPGEWWVNSDDAGAPVSLGPGVPLGASTARFVMRRLASYGGCYAVDNVTVRRTAKTGGEFVGDPPTPEISPEASQPPGGPWDSTKCTGNSPTTCETPPAGWCWVGDSVFTGSGVSIVACTDESDPAEGPAGPQTYVLTCNTGSSNTYQVGTALPARQDGDVIHFYYAVTSHGGVTRNQVGWGGSSGATSGFTPLIIEVAAGGANSWDYGTITANGDTLKVGSAASTYCRSTAASTWTLTMVFESGPTADGFDGDGDGWSDDQESACGSDPEDDTSVCPGGVPEPSGWPSPPPGQAGDGGGPVDQCEGSDDANLAMCSGEFNINVSFPPGEAFPSLGGGVADASGAAEGFERVFQNLGGKVPIGFAVQVGDAIADAAANPGAGNGPGSCFMCLDIPVWAPAEAGGAHTETVDIPIEEMASSAGTFRAVLLIILTAGFAVALLRIARGSVGAGGD